MRSGLTRESPSTTARPWIIRPRTSTIRRGPGSWDPLSVVKFATGPTTAASTSVRNHAIPRTKIAAIAPFHRMSFRAALAERRPSLPCRRRLGRHAPMRFRAVIRCAVGRCPAATSVRAPVTQAHVAPALSSAMSLAAAAARRPNSPAPRPTRARRPGARGHARALSIAGGTFAKSDAAPWRSRPRRGWLLESSRGGRRRPSPSRRRSRRSTRARGSAAGR